MSGLVKPPGLLAIMIDTDPAFDDDFNRWLDEEHVPERLACPGFTSARRFVATTGEPRYLTLYELAAVDAVETEQYRYHMANPTEWTKRTHGYRIRTIRNVYEELIESRAP